MPITQDQEGDPQDNFVESREPTEFIMCLVLAAAYAGLAKYCWEVLSKLNSAKLLLNVEGFFITIALLALVVGLRPYLSPCSLQLSKHGIKYRGPYWANRKTVNWSQIFRLYVSPELIIILYHPKSQSKGIWLLLIQSVYLADREQIPGALQKYCPVEPVMLGGPSIMARLVMIGGFAVVVTWILLMLAG